MGRTCTAVHVYAVLVLGCVYYARGQDCSSFADCRSCIQSPLQCQWCAKPNISGHCTRANGSSPSCKTEFLQNPNGAQTVLKDDSLSDDVQITPQAVSLKVRPGQPQSVPITVKPAAVFPLDVYFLMDFSGSMNDDLATLQSIARDIAHDISAISINFTVGFGAFLDKQTSPYISVRPDLLVTPCEAVETCEEPYSYRHFLSLTNDSSAFANAVNSRIISGNLDSPEGGMDGLLQAVVCQDIIGWRENPARRLLVYMTDASFHFGGDGKIGGVVTPHDGQCHLQRVTNGGETYYEYEEALRLDYPSIAMVKSLLLEKGIVPIFLVTSAQVGLYHLLQNALGSAVVRLLDEDSQNLINALTEGYAELVSNVKLTAESVSGLEVSFSADCGPFAVPDTAGGCTGLTIDSEITFTATISVTECTERLINGTSFKISSALFGKVTVDVQGVCSCDCEMNRMVNSSDCSNQGDLVCGLCECVEGRVGNMCECKLMDSPGLISHMCRTGPNGEMCSGPNAGECVCGQCRCRKNIIPQIPKSMYSGEMCECNNFQCGMNMRGQVCSGNGVCGCNGTCTCNEGFSGDICECRPNEVCRNPVGGETCGPKQCSRYTKCVTCRYKILDGVLQETGVESCLYICDAVEATVMADTISGSSGSPLDGTFTCITAPMNRPCNGITFYVKSNKDGSSDILVSNSPACCPTPTAMTPDNTALLIAVPIAVGLLIPILAFLAIVLAAIILFLKDHYKHVSPVNVSGNHQNLHRNSNQETQNPRFSANPDMWY